MARGFRLAAISGWSLLCCVVSVVSAQDTSTDRLEALNRALSAKAMWQAEFEQEYIPAGMTMGEEAEGRVWLAWPDRAVFHTGEPAFRLMGLHGRTVRLVDLNDETCDEHELSEREWERVPLAAILDPRGALVHFDVAERSDVGIVLTPKERGGVDRVEIVLDTGDLPAEVSIWDPQGAVNRLKFSAWAPSKEPPDGAWLPVSPDGLECAKDPGPLD